MSSDTSQPMCSGCSGENRSCVCHRPIRRGALLINHGTPDSPAAKDVRRYLREFLADPYVITLPKPLRWLTPALATMIATFRGGRSAEAYSQIWWDEGSPLKVITERQRDKLQDRLGGGWKVYSAMRYAQPSIGSAIQKIVDDGVTELVVLPMYPQHAGPTTATALDVLYRELQRTGNRLGVGIRSEWYNDQGYIEAQAQLLHRFMEARGLGSDSAYLLFSAHSMPVSYIRAGDPYEGQIRRSVRLVLDRLGWPERRTSLSFQSKLGPVPWLAPSTQDTLDELAARGERDVVVCPISFTSDCLETLEEIGIGGKERFESRSPGSTLHLVSALNDDDVFADALAGLVRRGSRPLPRSKTVKSLGTSVHRESLDALAGRLVMVGYSVAGSMTRREAPGLIDASLLRELGRGRQDAIGTVRALAAAPEIDGCVFVRTCQRSEIYAIVKKGCSIEGAADQIVGHMCGALESEPVAPSPAIRCGRAALGHLARVTLGLESVLIGESDASEQVRSAMRMADHAGTLSPAVGRVLERVLELDVEIRCETTWGGFSTSFADAALSALGERSLLDAGSWVVAGGSTTSRQIIRSLGETAARSLTFVHRGSSRADVIGFTREVAPLARRLCVDRYNDRSVLEAVEHADVLAIGIDSRSTVFGCDDLAGLRDFRDRPLTVIDFNAHGSTGDVDTIDGIRVIDCAELQRGISAYAQTRLACPGFRAALTHITAELDDRFGVDDGRTVLRRDAELTPLTVTPGHGMRHIVPGEPAAEPVLAMATSPTILGDAT
ncbi:MAG: ferrochelatase [Planctomycetota bacterium]